MEEFIIEYYCKKGYQVDISKMTFTITELTPDVVYKIEFELLSTGNYPVTIIKTYKYVVNYDYLSDFQDYITKELDRRQFENEFRQVVQKSDDFFDIIYYSNVQ